MIKKITKSWSGSMKNARINKANGRRKSVLLLVLLLAAVLLSSCAQSAPVEKTTYVMGSVMRQTLYGSGGEEAAAFAADAASELEAKISWKIDSSEIARLNENAGKEPISLSQETAALLWEALELSQASGGAFDPLILPLTSLWDFDSNPEHAPAKEQIEEVLPLCTVQPILLSQGLFFLPAEGSGIDLGAAGKGAACDAAVEIYREKELPAAVVSVGGSIGVFGKKPDGSDFKIAVRDPAGTLSDTLGYLTLSSQAFVSTSGDYEKYFVENGVKYSHILDPKTGYPVRSEVTSVSVVAESGALSDMLSTACFALGAEKSADLLSQYGAGAVFVYPSGEVLLAGSVDFTLTNDHYRVKTP